MKTTTLAGNRRTDRSIHASSQGFSRRQFLRGAAGVAAGATLGRMLPSRTMAAARDKGLPIPQRSGIEHIVNVMMENRSFDHLLGWLPGADGRQAGLTYTDRAGAPLSTYPLAPDYQGCGLSDPDHSYAGGRIEYNGGLCDGWLRAGENDRFAIGYYVKDDLSFLGNAAPAWTTCDRYFTSIMAGTYPNRVYQHAAQTDRLGNQLLPISNLPTIWDRLADHTISRKYYFSDFPFLALWGTKYVGISRPVSDFFSDCRAGTLPSVSFVEPRFAGEHLGLSNDYHPHGDIRNAEAFLNSVYEAVISSPNWSSTVLVINFDEWGGFFDHVPPPTAAIPTADAALGSDGLMGFRVPALVISPWSPRGTVAHGTYDHTSVLKMIEWRWNMRPLTVRDANASNLADLLDFDAPNLNAPRFTVPGGPFGTICVSLESLEEWGQHIVDYAATLGFPVPR
jgi:phospholipase C